MSATLKIQKYILSQALPDFFPSWKKLFPFFILGASLISMLIFFKPQKTNDYGQSTS
jgi:hypothetical protein